MRVGIGYDIHPLVRGRRLVLGGIEIPFEWGLSGWSDADVLTHAIIDALLGAAALGDIGYHFPPDAAEYQEISSLIRLAQHRAHGDPQRSFTDPMRLKLSQILGITPGDVSVKASTAAGLGFIGEGDGIEAQAVALIESVPGESHR